uniref:Uncharacterized protein n=1 Tax=Anguilla anguilla TaxID=7936 RepID=A0A0E9VCJ1_ANGAN
MNNHISHSLCYSRNLVSAENVI